MAAGTKAKNQAPKIKAEDLAPIYVALRNDQRSIAAKLYEIEGDLSEHKIVIEALKDTDAERKCFRMIGGVLVEGTVKDILPNLIANAEQLQILISTFESKLKDKTKEIADYREKHSGSLQYPDKIIEEEEPVEPVVDSNKGVLLADKT